MERKGVFRCRYLGEISKRQAKLGFFRCLKKNINIHISDCEKCEFYEPLLNILKKEKRGG